MARAIAPKEIPNLPNGASAWGRSTKRAGGVFHAHTIGFTMCHSIRLDRFNSVSPNGLGDFQYWGVCPKCFSLSKKLECEAA